MAPVPAKTSITGPQCRRAVSSDPILPQDSQLQVYDIYIIRRVLLAATRDVNILIWTSRSPSFMKQMIALWSMVKVQRADGRRFKYDARL